MDPVTRFFVKLSLAGYMIVESLQPTQTMHQLQDYPEEIREAVAERSRTLTLRDRTFFAVVKQFFPKFFAGKPLLDIKKDMQRKRKRSKYDLQLPPPFATEPSLRHLFVRHNKKFSRLYIYIHGGGFVLGQPTLNLAPWAKKARANYLAVNMRLCPEATIYDAIEDCYACYRYAIEELRYSPKNIVLLGESAGATLITCLLDKIRTVGRDQGQSISEMMPCCVVLSSPCLDLTASCESRKRNQASDVILLPEMMQGFEQYIREAHGTVSKEDERKLSAIFFESKEGFPPTFISVSADELFCDECLVYARQLREAGIDVELDCTTTFTVHAYQMFYNLHDAGMITMKKAQQFALKHLESA